MSEEKQIKAANRKVITIALAYLVLILFFAWALDPSCSLYRLGVFTCSTIFFGYCAFRDTRRVTYKKLCQGCKENLYPFIYTGENLKRTVKYCPECGVSVN